VHDAFGKAKEISELVAEPFEEISISDDELTAFVYEEETSPAIKTNDLPLVPLVPATQNLNPAKQNQNYSMQEPPLEFLPRQHESARVATTAC